MSDSSSPLSEPEYLILGRKLVLLSLLMIVTALSLVTLVWNIWVHSLLLAHLLADSVMGLTAGFSVRKVLQKQTFSLRIASVLGFLVGGLELMGWFTNWNIGLVPLKLGLSKVDWFSLVQLVLGTGIALLVLFAWTKPSPLIVSPDPKPRTVRRASHTRKQVEKRAKKKSRTKVQAKNSTVVKKSVESKPKRVSKRKSALLLSSEEEHRCPYCLELIKSDDPRGTVECKICHTLHHADCWAITGTCQVPHYTN